MASPLLTTSKRCRSFVAKMAAASAQPSRGAAHHGPGWMTIQTLNSNVTAAQYAVRGELVLKAMQHAAALKRGEKRPFNALIFCNIGNPQELGQKPVTFNRQVAALINHPPLLDDPDIVKKFPADVIERARHYMSLMHGGMGAYTHSMGTEGIREEIAAFITRRDGGAPAKASDIFLTDGASPGVQLCMKAMLRKGTDAVLVPIPQYPLYSASIALFGGTMANYYLTEEKGWALELAELERALHDARSRGLHVRALTVINPGNPTGNTLTVEDMRQVLDFCHRHKLVLLADEVYQDNIWAQGKTWASFRKVALEMGLVDPLDSTKNAGLQLVSFHSTSKGFTGECGRRGGYLELLGVPEDVRMQLYKLASISLCSNSNGQIMTALMCNPPTPGQPSYDLYASEKEGILASLKRRAHKLTTAFNALPGMSCQPSEGALYAFPKVDLPAKAIAAASAAGKAADTLYCLELLDATGIVVVPGSGFGQREGTWHFRSTILPSEAEIDSVIDRISAFHKAFMAKYA